MKTEIILTPEVQAVVDAIATAKTGAQDKPATDITINSVTVA